MSTYETVDGTEPIQTQEHEPRTIVRTNTDDEIYMMSEIGDGVFVAWGDCRKCKLRANVCQCAGGPVEADYITRWRNDRFKPELNSRPEPDRKILDSVIEALVARGYKVTKPKGAPADPEVAEVTEEVLVDSGLNEALESVKALKEARDTSDIEVDF